MSRSLQGKLIFSYLAVAFITVLVVSALIWLTSGQSLMNLVMEQQTALLSESVQSYYAANGTLEGFFENYVQSNPFHSLPPPGGAPAQPPDRRPELRGVYGLVDTGYRALLPSPGYALGEVVPAERLKDAIAVQVDGQTVAWILPDTSLQFKLSAEEEVFLRRTSLAIGLAAISGVLAAVAIGVWLSGRLLQPIRRLTQAARSLAHGDLQQQVPVSSRDELGLLTTTFNQMSADLAHADQQRKRLTADITHDLSTPLQIIAGYIEMLEEGGVPLTPQRIEIIKTEIGHLRRLVSDLGTLTQVESGGLDIQPQAVQPGALLQTIYHAYQPIADGEGVTLTMDAPDGIPDIWVDEGRMQQVFKNLLDNALRHTPPGGQITLGVALTGGQVQLRVTDSGAGIAADDLPYVFDRFYQADKARSANSGKMGLGLAICKALVQAQGGQIAAESAGPGLGTTIVLSFAPAG